MAIECRIIGIVTDFGNSKDGVTKYMSVKVYEDSDYTVSVLKCPINIDEMLHVGDEINIAVTPRAFAAVGQKPRVTYYYKV